MLNNRLSAKFTSSTTSSLTATNQKNKKTSQAFQFLRSKPPINPVIIETPVLKLENKMIEEEFLEADQFDFDQLQSAPKAQTPSSTSLSSSRLSLPAAQCQFNQNLEKKGSTKQRLFNFIYNNSSKAVIKEQSVQQTNQQRRLSDFHRPTKVCFLSFLKEKF